MVSSKFSSARLFSWMLILFKTFAQFAIFLSWAKSDLNETSWALSNVTLQNHEFDLKMVCQWYVIESTQHLLAACLYDYFLDIL